MKTLGLNGLMKGYSKLELILRNFNGMDSPVPCSSDVRISPNNQSIIEKTKKPGKRSNNSLKMVWEFLQFEILNKLFQIYSQQSDIKLHVPQPIAVYPSQHKLLTSFCSGFILHSFNQVERGTKAIHLNTEVPIELSVAYHLGALNKLKELEGVYHSDYDLRHVIFDPIKKRMAMFDLENSRYVTSKNKLNAESAGIVQQWFKLAEGRGMSKTDLLNFYYQGYEKVKRAEKNYIAVVGEVEEEYGVQIAVTRGEIDGCDVGLRTIRS